jgi:transcriptional regulator with XRE-family HTH domain
MDIGYRLRSLREQKNLSQEEVVKTNWIDSLLYLSGRERPYRPIRRNNGKNGTRT